MLKPFERIKPLQISILIGIAWLFVFLYKFNDLFLPYFWDEMSGYMSGIIYMCDNGISLHPRAVPPAMSYGHPLLMHATLAVVMSTISDSVFAMHFTTLVFTFITSLGVYLLALELTKNQVVALFSFAIFLIQPIVLAQSTQVVLEMFLTMHTVFSIYFFIKKKYFLSVLFCVFGILTKETGLVLAIALVSQVVLERIIGIEKEKFIKKIILFLIPFGVFALFLLLTKQSFGWYLNPVNVGKTNPEIGSILQKIWDYPLEFTFINQGRFVFSLICVVALVIYFLQKKSEKMKGSMQLVLILIFCFGFILFSSIADTLERYFIMLIPFAAIIFAMALNFFKRINIVIPFVLLVFGMLSNVFALETSHRYTEVDMGYRHYIRTNVEMFNYLNSGKFKDDTVSIAFPLLYAPIDPRFGYYETLNFTADTSVNADCLYRVYTSPGNLDWNPPDTSEFSKIQHFKSEYSHSLLFKKKF